MLHFFFKVKLFLFSYLMLPVKASGRMLALSPLAVLISSWSQVAHKLCKMTMMQWDLRKSRMLQGIERAEEYVVKYCPWETRLLLRCEVEGDGCGGVKGPTALEVSELSAWETKYSSATTISLISGRNCACSCRHIAVMATAWCKERTGKRPCSCGSTNWTNFFRSFRKGRDCHQGEKIEYIKQD